MNLIRFLRQCLSMYKPCHHHHHHHHCCYSEFHLLVAGVGLEGTGRLLDFFYFVWKHFLSGSSTQTKPIRQINGHKELKPARVRASPACLPAGGARGRAGIPSPLPVFWKDGVLPLGSQSMGCPGQDDRHIKMSDLFVALGDKWGRSGGYQEPLLAQPLFLGLQLYLEKSLETEGREAGQFRVSAEPACALLWVGPSFGWVTHVRRALGLCPALCQVLTALVISVDPHASPPRGSFQD